MTRPYCGAVRFTPNLAAHADEENVIAELDEVQRDAAIVGDSHGSKQSPLLLVIGRPTQLPTCQAAAECGGHSGDGRDREGGGGRGDTADDHRNFPCMA